MLRREQKTQRRKQNINEPKLITPIIKCSAANSSTQNRIATKIIPRRNQPAH
jgi:hypothetical protein